MKYLLLDTISGAYLKNCSGSRIQFTHDIHNAVLFPSEANATRAFKKLIDENGSFKHPRWWMMQKNKHATEYFVSEAAKSKRVTELQSDPYRTNEYGLRWEHLTIDHFKNQEIVPYKLEAHYIEFTLGPAISS
jgi:hypothetical protein